MLFTGHILGHQHQDMAWQLFQVLAAHLDHEALDAAVEDRVGVVAALGQHQEVFAGARRNVAVQLQVEVAQRCVQAHVGLLLGVALYAHQRPGVLRLHIDRRGGERP